MTNYGAIPTTSHASSVVDVESISRAEQHNNRCQTRRPWRVMFDFHSMGIPRGVSDASSRIKTNLTYFRMNYSIVFWTVMLIFIFVSLIKHPISLILFTVLILLWFFLCFHRDEPIKLFRYQINDRTVLIYCLLFTTVALLVLTNATYNIIGAYYSIGSVLVLIHPVVRKTEDLFLDEEAASNEISWKLEYLSAFLSCLLGCYFVFKTPYYVR